MMANHPITTAILTALTLIWTLGSEALVHVGAQDPTNEGYVVTAGDSGASALRVTRESRFPGTHAWEIVGATDGRLRYEQTGPNAADAWVLSSRLRVVDLNDTPDAGMLLEAANGERRFLLFLGSDAEGATLINIEEPDFPELNDVVIPPQQAGDTDYVHLELSFDPALAEATLFVNGGIAASGLKGIAGDQRRVNFGDGSTLATGRARFATVEFSIGAPACADGKDNNNDGLVDFAAGDSSCLSSADPSEGAYCPIGRDLDADGDCELVFISHEGDTPPAEQGWMAPAASTGQSYEAGDTDIGVGNCPDPCSFWRVTDNSLSGQGFYTLSTFPADAPGGWEVVALVRPNPNSKDTTAAPTNSRFMQVLIPDGNSLTTSLQFSTQFGHQNSERMLLDPPTQGAVADIGPLSKYHEIRLVYNPAENNIDVLIDGTLRFANRRPTRISFPSSRQVRWGSASTPERGQTHWQQFHVILNPDTDNDGLSNETERTTTGTNPFVADTDDDGVLDGVEVAMGSNPQAADSDGDSLLDGFEVANGLNPAVADADSDQDGDGLTALQEQSAGTRVDLADTDGDGIDDGAEVNDHNTDPTLADTDDDGLTDGTEINEHQTDPLLADSDADGFLDNYELQTSGTDPNNPDSDDDGLNDAQESAQGTNPLVADTDSDGLLDGFEVRFQFDPLAAGEANQDADGDGLSNADEQDAGSDPTTIDTDGDTLSDADEVLVHNSSPASRDTDEDGLHDNFEITWGLDPLVLDNVNADPDNDGLTQLREQTAQTNPTLVDTDGDGLTDGEEVNVLGTNPLVAEGTGVPQRALTTMRFTAVDQPLFTDAPEPLRIDIPIPENAQQSQRFGRKETIRQPVPLFAAQTAWERGIAQCDATSVTESTHPSCSSITVSPTRSQCINGGDISIRNQSINCCANSVTGVIDPLDRFDNRCRIGNSSQSFTVDDANDSLPGSPVPTSVNGGPPRPKPTKAPPDRDYTVGAEFALDFAVEAAVEIAIQSPETGSVDIDYKTQASARVNTSTATPGDIVRLDLRHTPYGITNEFRPVSTMISQWPTENLFVSYIADANLNGNLDYWSIDPEDGDQIANSITIGKTEPPETGELINFEFLADEKLELRFMEGVEYVPEGYRDIGFEITSDDFLIGSFLAPGSSIEFEFTNPAECPKPKTDGGGSGGGSGNSGNNQSSGDGKCNNLPAKQPVSKLLANVAFQIAELNTPVSEDFNGGTETNFSIEKIVPKRSELNGDYHLTSTVPNRFRPFLNYTTDAEDKSLLQSMIDTFLKDNTRLSSDTSRLSLDIDGIVAPAFPSAQGGVAILGKDVISYNVEAADLDLILFAGWEQELSFDPGVVADITFSKNVMVQMQPGGAFVDVPAGESLSLPLANRAQLWFQQPQGGVDIDVNYSFRNNLFDNKTFQTVSLVGQLGVAKAGVGGIVGSVISAGISTLLGTEFPLDFTAIRYSLGTNNFVGARRGETNPLVPRQMSYPGGTLMVTDLTQDADGDGLLDALENSSCTSVNDADSDDDGLSDSFEDINRNGLVDPGETDPCNPDTDGDTLPDGAERGLQTAGTDTNPALFVADTSPTTSTDPALADTDADGLDDNEEENVYRTNPRHADSDGDGVSDGDEVNLFGTDPNSADIDTDGDGLANEIDSDDDDDGIDDSAELAAALDPLDATDATADADGDGSSNLAEYQAGTGMADPNSKPEDANQPSVLATAVLPGSRSTTVGQSVSAFATLINSGTEDAENCGFAPLSPIPAEFGFQRTDPATNQIVGARNALEPIAAGTSQTYAFFFKALEVLDREIELRFHCENTTPAQTLERINTFRFQASTAPSPDIIALAAAGTDGIARLANGVGAFAVATVNVGAGDWISARATVPGEDTLVANLCRTNATTGMCENPTQPVAEVMEQIDAGQSSTFSVFLSTSNSIPLDAANNRVFVEFLDSNGVIRGTTSVAVTTEE